MRVSSLALGAVLFAGASLPAFAQTPPATAPEKPTAPATETVAKPGVVVTGTVEANYTYNFNDPFNGSNTYLYNTRDGQFSINLAEIKINKAATPASRAGFTVRLIDGEVKRRNFNPGESTDNVLEAYGSYLVPLGARDLKVDVGQFVTHVGYETIEVGTNNFFSRNFLFQYPSPFYNAGVRASLPLSSKLNVAGYIYNRYNGTANDGTKSIAPGFQISYAPNGSSSLTLNGLTSDENLAYTGSTDSNGLYPSNRQQTSILDLIYQGTIINRLKIVGEGLYRFGDDFAGKSYDAYGFAGYLIYTQSNGNTIGLRGETYQQNDAVTVGGAGVNQLAVYPNNPGDKVNLSSITLSYEIKNSLFEGARTIFEYRYDKAGKDFFQGDKDNTFKKSQNTLTIGQIFTF